MQSIKHFALLKVNTFLYGKNTKKKLVHLLLFFSIFINVYFKIEFTPSLMCRTHRKFPILFRDYGLL